MGSRFPVLSVQHALEKLVLERTDEVLDVPEAVRYLLTVSVLVCSCFVVLNEFLFVFFVLLQESNVQRDVHQLKMLSRWCQCSATDALRVRTKKEKSFVGSDFDKVLLSRFGGHSFVTQWAGTVLQALGKQKKEKMSFPLFSLFFSRNKKSVVLSSSVGASVALGQVGPSV
jgi:hypothetical protein